MDNNCEQTQEDEDNEDACECQKNGGEYMVWGMVIGLIVGSVVDWLNPGLGLVVGMVIGMCIKKKEQDCTNDS